MIKRNISGIALIISLCTSPHLQAMELSPGDDPSQIEIPATLRMPSFLPDRPLDEAVTSLAAVTGARLAGLDPACLNGVNWVQAAKAWFDPETGLYRSSRNNRSSVIHSGIYGYWSAAMGLIFAAQYPDDPELKEHLRRGIEAFEKIAYGLGCPDSPDFSGLGFNFQPRYARMIARYALHTANNARLFQGVGLDADHQDHRAWKDQWDPADLLFYEALASSEWSSEKKFHPYATGDAIRLGWGTAKVEREAY